MRHAVIIIHGIGEQKPMNTLRGFVSTVTHQAGTNGEDIPFFNKPDELSDLFELRRLTTASSDKRGRTKTDFYEYYWAHHNRDTTVKQVLMWIWEILFRWPGAIPARVRFLHIFLWILLILFIALAIAGHKVPFFQEHQPVWIGALGSLVAGIVSYALTKYIGDAARYTSAKPDNIAERQKIRQEGLTLLRTLQKNPEYERIILVGHSLGCIIGYDLIRNLWAECNLKYQHLNYPKDLLEFEKKYASPTGHLNVKQYQEDQETLFYQQISDGNPWKISHFITLGSPLTYSSLLLASNTRQLHQRIIEREYPTAPPVNEIVDGEDRITYRPDVSKSRRVLHHGAPFACTQWINAYYGNDYVGGSLTPYFGLGIKEHKLTIKGSFFLRWIPFLSHTHYWSDKPGDFVHSDEAAILLKDIIWK